MFITCILIQDTFRHSVPEGLRKMHATACSDIRFSACYPYTIFAFFNPPCHCTLWQHSHTGIYFTPPAVQLFIFPSANLQFELQIMLQLLCSAPRNRNKMLAHTLTHTHVRTLEHSGAHSSKTIVRTHVHIHVAQAVWTTFGKLRLRQKRCNTLIFDIHCYS